SRWHSDDTNFNGESCRFTGGAYHAIQESIRYDTTCSIEGDFSNFAFEVQLTITQGDCGGIRLSQDMENLFTYYFGICQDDTYMAKKYGYSGDHEVQTRSSISSSSAIHAGRSQQNKIALVASGSTMTFYVNEQPIDHVQERSSVSVKMALIA